MAQENGSKGSGVHSNTISSPPPFSIIAKMNCMYSNFKYTTILCWFKLKKQTNISVSKFQLVQLKKEFGVDYLTLVSDNAPITDLKECLGTALEEINILLGEIEDNLEQIDEKELRFNSKMAKMKSPKTRESAKVNAGKPLSAHLKENTKTRRNSNDDDFYDCDVTLDSTIPSPITSSK